MTTKEKTKVETVDVEAVEAMQEVISPESVGVGETDGTSVETQEAVVVSVEAVDETPDTVLDTVRKEARRIMKANNVKEIWCCPKKGYWFTRKDYADVHAKKMDVVMKHIEWED